MTPREIVAVIRPEEVELTTGRGADGLTPVGTGVVQELQFAGATERLRVRMPMEGPVPATPDREGADGSGWLLDATRTFPEQRANPLAIGQKVTVSARRIHSLPTPISSFTVIAREQAAAERLRDTPLLATLATRMQTRITMRTTRTASAPPGMPVLAAGAGASATALWNLAHGASQILVLPAGAPLPTRIVVLPGAEAGVGALGVAASLLRHIPAESVLLAIHEAATPERERASRLRLLLDARSRALSEHGLDLRTELRFGDPDEELARELSVDPNSMLVLGLDSLDDAETARLATLLEGPQLAARADRARAGRDGLSMAGGRIAAPSPLPGFGLTFGFTTFFLSAVILLPLAAMVIRALGIPPAAAVRDAARRARGRLLPAVLRRGRARRRDQRRVRLHRRLVAGALRLPGPAPARHDDRPAVRAADRGLRHRARDRVLADRLARPEARPRPASRSPTPGSASWSRWC